MQDLTALHPTDNGRHVGVIDIGSNSIRLVVFGGDQRTPIPVFNEKALCRLGAGLDETNHLSQAGQAAAIRNIARFVEMAGEMNLSRLDIVATSAMRDARNGAEFARDLKDRFGQDIKVLSGDTEARLSALGVISAFPEADGVVGDLGGGSLELIDIAQGAARRTASLPLGSLRLGDLTAERRCMLTRLIDDHLDRLGWIERVAGRDFFAVGGVWRSLARAYMEDIAYPLQVIHGYTVAGATAESYCEQLAALDPGVLQSVVGVARRRLNSLPVGALLLARLLRRGRPARVVFSVFGLREGILYDRLSLLARETDPLLVSCREIADKVGRFPAAATALENWISGFLPGLSPNDRRMLQAIAVLSDLAWSEHPRYRGEHAYLKVLRLPVVGMTHGDRVFVARAIFARYSGAARPPEEPPVQALIDEVQARKALLIGLAARLAIALSGGMERFLLETTVRMHANRVAVIHSPELAVVHGDVVQRRAAELSESLGRTITFECAALPQQASVQATA